jgi:hypothetical protein
MEAQLTEASTFPAQLYSSSFFAKLPTDSRFIQCTYHKFMPTSTLSAKTIEFNLDKFDAANVYLIQDTNIEVQLKITKADGSLPNPTSQVAPINNVLHSLWKAVRLTINDVQVYLQPDLYHYKSYINNCLTYSNACKSTHLQTQGFYADLAGFFPPTASNSGFTTRNQLFRKGYAAAGAYRPEGARFFGRLLHDLVGCESGLPPQCRVRIELDRNEDELFLMCLQSDTEKYKTVIEKLMLYVPVALLSSTVNNEINAVLAETKSISIHYRRIEIRQITIPKNKREVFTESLFPDSDLPCRIVVCFVDGTAKTGSYHTNPFEFRRSWEVDAVDSDNRPDPDRMEERIAEKLDQKLNRKFSTFQEEMLTKFSMFQTSIGGKGRGKRSQQNLEAEIKKQAEARLRQFLNENLNPVNPLPGPSNACPSATNSSQPQSRSPSEFLTDDDDQPLRPRSVQATKTIYLKKLDCLLNAVPIDQIEDYQTEDECMSAFWRFQTYTGLNNSLYTNGITYTDFR